MELRRQARSRDKVARNRIRSGGAHDLGDGRRGSRKGWWRSSRATSAMPRCYEVKAATRRQGTRVDEAELTARLHALRQEHRDLDAAIDALRSVPGHDQIQLARLKKRKLRLRDEMQIVQDWLVPDIIA